MSNQRDSTDRAEDDTYIFVAYITTRNGKRIYAHEKGKKAFRIKVKSEKKPKK